MAISNSNQGKQISSFGKAPKLVKKPKQKKG